MAKQTIIPPSAATNGPITYGAFMDRFIALLIDVMMLYLIQITLFVPLTNLLVATIGISSSFFVTSMEGDPAFFSSILVLQWIYSAGFESSRYGATLGKRAMNLRVVDEDGMKVSFGYATLRFFFKWVSAFPLMLGFIMAIFTRKHQALHDIVAQTMVLSVIRDKQSL